MTYVLPRLEISRVNGILVETVPLLERLLGHLLVFIVPAQHVRLELLVDGVAVLPENTLWIIKEIVGVNDADLNTARLLDSAAIIATLDTRTNETGILAVIEKAAKLIVAGLAREEVVETGLLHERRDTAAVVAGDGVFRMADQEGEMKLLKELPWHDSRITLLSGCRVGKGSALGRLGNNDTGIGIIASLLDLAIRHRRLAVGANATLGNQRRRNVRLLLLWREEVVGDVFDEDTLALKTALSARLIK